MKEQTIEVFVCERCKVLLLEVDQAFVTYRRSELTEEGYVWKIPSDEDDEEVYQSLCPFCSGTDHPDHDKTLKEVSLPKKVWIDLTGLWSKYKENKYDFNFQEQHFLEAGLPLTIREVKNLLTKELL